MDNNELLFQNKDNHPELVSLDTKALLDKHPQLHMEHDTFNVPVAVPFGRQMSAEETFKCYCEHDGAGKPAHMYLHVPLCEYICHFCNYTKMRIPQSGKKQDTLLEWTDLLIDESSRYLKQVNWLPKARIESLYIGGGTGSVLLDGDGCLEKLMRHLKSNYFLTDDCEISLEGNPDNFTKDNIKKAMACGINRFSVGIQTLHDEINKFCNRDHTAEQSILTVKHLLDTGLPFNVDMMFGLPYQTPDQIEKDIRTLVDMGTPTVTLYRLRNSDRESSGLGKKSAWNFSKLHNKLEKKGLFPKLYEVHEMRKRAIDILKENEYLPSPCTWWNKKGAYQSGNIPQLSRNKWQNHDTMIGFGPCAYGWLTGGNPYLIQTHNENDINKYVEHMRTKDTVPLVKGLFIEGHQAATTALAYGYIANQPIYLDRFRNQFGVELLEDEPYASILKEMIDDDLLYYTNLSSGDYLQIPLEVESLVNEIIFTYFVGRMGASSDVACSRFGTV